MNTEQKAILSDMMNKLIDANSLLISVLERLRPSDQREYIPKVQKQMKETDIIINRVKEINISDNIGISPSPIKQKI